MLILALYVDSLLGKRQGSTWRSPVFGNHPIDAENARTTNSETETVALFSPQELSFNYYLRVEVRDEYRISKEGLCVN